MADVQLCGMRFAATTAGNVHSIGAATLRLQLSNASNALSVSLDGPFQALLFRSLSFVLPCQVQNGTIEITAGTDQWTGDTDIAFGFSTAPIGLRSIDLSDDPSLAIRFAADFAQAVKTAMGVARSGILEDYRIRWTLNWTSSLFSLDAAAGEIPMWPVGGAPSLELADRFGPPQGPKVRQLLSLKKMRLRANGFDTLFEPNAGALYLNPDVLDPARSSDGKTNAFLYQHVVSEAFLTGFFDYSGEWKSSRWQLEPLVGDQGLRLAIPALKDEQGHPLIFSISNSLPLTDRRGLLAPETRPAGRTNRAIVIGDADAVFVVPAHMDTLDPVTLYGKKRAPDALAAEYLRTPYWIDNGVAPLQGRRPREILGLASDTRLVLDPPSDTARAPSPPEAVKLVFAPFKSATGGLRFMLPSMKLGIENEGPLSTLYEMDLPEKETFERAANGVLTAEISRRTSRAKRRSLSLPLLDVKWALSNLHGKGAADAVDVLGAQWLDGLEEIAKNAFPMPEPKGYQHREGHRAAPNLLPFLRILPQPPASTSGPGKSLDRRQVALSATTLQEPPLPLIARRGRAPHAQFLFGGPPNPQGLLGAPFADPLADAAAKLEAGRQALSAPLEQFFWFWAGLPATPPAGWEAARDALRDYLVGLRPALGANPDTWSFEDFIEASERLESARRLLASNPADSLGFQDYEDVLAQALPDEVAELIDPDKGSSLLERLFQYAFAPPTMELAKRAIEALASGKLDAHRPVLEHYLTNTLQTAIADFFKGAGVPDGLLAELLQGLPPLFAIAQELWRDPGQLADEARAILEDLAERYGPELTLDVLNTLLQDPGDSEAFASVLRDLGYALPRLADLAADPPDYLIVSRKLRRPYSGDPSANPSSLRPDERAAALWNHRFDFCKFGGGKAWDMFFDDSTTLIFKLGGERGLPAILSEVTKAYAAEGRTDPFALDPSGQAPDPAAAFSALLPEDLASADWRGALVVNPSVDLENDDVLSTLCGFSHIQARFAAVGGRAAADNLPAKLDVWGCIEKAAENEGWTDPDGKPDAAPAWGAGDVGWSLTRFYATVRGTTILSADIAFKLEVREMFGRRFDWEPITVAGTLPPTTGSATGKPRDLSFSATFDEPRKLEIDAAFLERVELRSIRVGSHNGDTVLDIDADLFCNDDISIGLEAPDLIELNEFRIRLPKVDLGRAVPMGFRRPLKFDLGAIRIPVAKGPRLTVDGLDIRPVGMGLLRGKPADIRKRLYAETLPLREPFGPKAPPGETFAYPYVDTRVEFGRSTTLDAGSQFALVARVGIPISASETPQSKPKTWTPGVGLASLSGRDLKISLFRLLTIEFKEIEAGIFDLDNQQKAGAIWADGFNLSILSWKLFKDEDPATNAARTIVYAHDIEDRTKRGFLAWYANPKPSSAFFRLQWLLVAKNIKPKETHLYKSLLSLSNAKLEPELKAVRELKSGKTLKFGIDDSGWLLGIRFKIGDLFDPCVLLFHDDRFYGIRLGGKIAKLITGEDDISLAYIPGPTPSEDRFRAAMRIAALDMMGPMRSGDVAIEWTPRWDALLDFGQPWRGANGFMWERAFSIPMGAYEAKFGFFVEKRTSVVPPEGVLASPGAQYLTLSAGAGFYFGYFFGAGNSVAWVRAGIGVFGVLIGSATLRMPADPGKNPLALLKTSLAKLEVIGALGIYAYGEGGVDVWILSARFRVSAQAFVEVKLVYIPDARSYLTYSAMLAAHYSASVKVGSGMFSWTFRVSGSVQMQISGSASFG